VTEAEMPKTADGVELDDETREDLARWQSYVETGHAIPHETVMVWLDDLAAEADRRAEEA
jgi:predicted transcriptional regulator